MKQKRDSQFIVLRTLRDFAFLSEFQLRWVWGWTQAKMQYYLWQAHKQGWVYRHPFYDETKCATVWVYALTEHGLQFLLKREPMPLPDYLQKYNYSISRLRWLALVLERVYYSRQVLYDLQRSNDGWRIIRWNSETEVRYTLRNGARRLFFHCTANFENEKANRWLRIAIEWDTGEIPIEAQEGQWQNFLRANHECDLAYGNDSHFPILFYVAQDWKRLIQFERLLWKISDKTQWYIPEVWMTYRARLAQADASPSEIGVWLSPTMNERTWVAQPLNRYEGVAREPARFWRPRPWRMSFHGKQVELRPLDESTMPNCKLLDLARLALSLNSLEKKLIRHIGSHPMLTANELATVLESTPSKVWQGLGRLTRWKLIKAHRSHEFSPQLRRRDMVKVYTLTDLGVGYLASAAGFGVTPKRFAAAKGWEDGFGAQIYHAEHTRIGNAFFIQLLQYAREQHANVTWFSEQEARLFFNLENNTWRGPHETYYISPSSNRQPSEREEENAGEHEGWMVSSGGYGNRREFFQQLAEYGKNFRRFLPDGRAELKLGNDLWHIAVEIDLTRASYKKMLTKFEYYYIFQRQFDHPNLCILLVTHHWQRAKNLYWLAWRYAVYEMDWHCRHELDLWTLPWDRSLEEAERRFPDPLRLAVLPLYITTTEELRAHGMRQAIWLRVREPLDKDGRVNHTMTKTRWLERIEEKSMNSVPNEK